jgi:hypothetical protein
VAAGEPASSAIKLFGSPFAAALLFTLTVLTSPVSREIPIAVRELFQILACVPMIFLIRQIAGAWMVRALSLDLTKRKKSYAKKLERVGEV